MNDSSDESFSDDGYSNKKNKSKRRKHNENENKPIDNERNKKPGRKSSRMKATSSNTNFD